MFGKKQTLILLTIIFLLGAFLRLINLSQIPAGFQMDEASKGYSAYSILKTGKDDNNNFLPLTIDMFGDNSPAGYHYIAIPSVAVFGLNEFAVRFPGALLGSLTILAFYFLIYSIFLDKKISLLGSFLLSISPWHINLSRASSESLVALFFIILGFSLIFWAIKSNAIKYISIGTVILATSFLFYQTPRLFVPAFFFVFLLHAFWKLKLTGKLKKALLISFIFLSVLVALLFFAVSGGSGRFNQVSIFNYPQTKLIMEEQIRGEGMLGTNVNISRAFHNKVISYGQTYVSNYLEYFSWNFFFTGGLPVMYQIPGMGLTYLIEFPFVILGLLFLVLDKNKFSKVFLIWFLLGPAAASIAVDTNNLQRAIVLFPMLEVLAACGLFYLFTSLIKKRKTIWFTAILLFFIFNFLYFYHQYYVLGKVYQPWFRNNGFGQMMSIINKDYKNYDHIITTKSNGGYPLFQFYTKYDPVTYQKEGSPKDKDDKGFGRFIFSPFACPLSSKDGKLPKTGSAVFVEDGNCKEAELLKNYQYSYILRSDTTKAFRIVFVNDLEKWHQSITLLEK
jgi:4-amino-4-deoxy-L-arabinose transferase-like glycosyltransferase